MGQSVVYWDQRPSVKSQPQMHQFGAKSGLCSSDWYSWYYSSQITQQFNICHEYTAAGWRAGANNTDMSSASVPRWIISSVHLNLHQDGAQSQISFVQVRHTREHHSLCPCDGYFCCCLTLPILLGLSEQHSSNFLEVGLSFSSLDTQFSHTFMTPLMNLPKTVLYSLPSPRRGGAYI